MISMMIFLLVLGLIVFGPKKTIEMAQSVGRSAAQLKKSVAESELGSIMNPGGDDISRRIDAILTQQQAPSAQPPAAAVNPDHSHSTGLA